MSWWADGRYRRFLLHSIQAALKPIADGVAPTDAESARWQRLRGKSYLVPTTTPATAEFRSTRCAFDREAAPLVLHHQQMRDRMLIAAACEGEEEAIVKPTFAVQESVEATLGRSAETGTGRRLSPATAPVDPDIAWTTRTSGATPLPALAASR